MHVSGTHRPYNQESRPHPCFGESHGHCMDKTCDKTFIPKQWCLPVWPYSSGPNSCHLTRLPPQRATVSSEAIQAKQQWLGICLCCWKRYIVAIRKTKEYVYGIWVYNVLGIWKGYYRVKTSLVSFMKLWTKARNNNEYLKYHSKLT